MKDYLLEILFDTADEELEEQIQSLLFLSASTGSTSDESGVRAWFESAQARDDAMPLFDHLAGVQLHAADPEHVDWLEHYQQSLEPLFIGQRFVVSPDPSLLPRDSSRLQLIVPQEQAFGTGSHETTTLCLEALEETNVSGARGLDVGSGSGILAMAMLRLGATRVIAFDNDPDTYAALYENRMRNGIAPRQMPVFIGSLDALRGGRFDVVTMNILPDVVMRLLPDVRRLAATDARLIVSGILTSRADEVIDCARRQSLALVRGLEKGEWWAGELRVA